ncbi:MAG: FlgO family outer membrane protein, partial [Campylobacterota bacterium]|nr:FlgO family outer membrane protein [Campylobacterota bacterium]
MNKIKHIILISTLIFFTACSSKTFSWDSSTDYDQIISQLLKKAANQIFPNIKKDEVLLVSNFAETTTLRSDTKLSFVLSDMLKNKLVSKYSYTVREIELSKQFRIGKEGFKVLTRDASKINNSVIAARYAVVGNYTVTKNQLILFLKLIDIQNGYVLASSTYSTDLTDDIEELNKKVLEVTNEIYQP